MQVSVETSEGLTRKLTITLPSADFEEQISGRLVDAARKVRIDGFRPGKVPLKEVRRRFGPSVRQEVAGELMQSSFIEAVQREDLSPACAPSLTVVSLDAGADLEFTATFEVFPDVELADLSQVEVKKPELEVTEDDVDKMIERLREQRKHWHELDRAVRDGDRVTVDFLGRLDGDEFDGGKGEDVSFILGQGQMIEDFDNAVIGMSPGDEKTITATFPEDYQAEQLQGRTADFDVTLKKAEEAHLPELDDAFFKSFGIEESVEEGGENRFRDDVRDNMLAESKAATQGQVKRQVLDEIARLHDIALPGALIEREVQGLRNQMLQQLGISPRGPADPELLPDEPFRKEAEKRVTIGLVVNEIVNRESLKPDSERVRERINEIAKPYDQPDQVVNWYYGDEAQLQQVEMAVLEDQVVEHVLSLAKVSTLPSSYDEVISGRATAPEPASQDAAASSDAADAAATSDATSSTDDVAETENNAEES